MQREENWPWRQTPAGTPLNLCDLRQVPSPPDPPLFSQGQGFENAGLREVGTRDRMILGGSEAFRFISVVVDAFIVCWTRQMQLASDSGSWMPLLRECLCVCDERPPDFRDVLGGNAGGGRALHISVPTSGRRERL